MSHTKSDEKPTNMPTKRDDRDQRSDKYAEKDEQAQAQRSSDIVRGAPTASRANGGYDQKQHHSIQSESKGQCHRPERRGFAELFRADARDG